MDRIQIFPKPFGPGSIAPSPPGKFYSNRNEGLGQKRQEKPLRQLSTLLKQVFET